MACRRCLLTGEPDLDAAKAAALDASTECAERLLLLHGAGSQRHPSGCATAAAQARELLRLLLLGQGNLSDAELCSALAHVCGMLGSAWGDTYDEAFAAALAAQIRWEPAVMRHKVMYV